MICANELYRNCLAASAGHKMWVILWFITGIQHKLRNYSVAGNADYEISENFRFLVGLSGKYLPN